MYLDPSGNPTEKSVTGHLAAGVPGSVAGMAEATKRYGTIPLAKLIEPAERLARDGFVIDSFRNRSIDGSKDRLAKFQTSRRQFLPNGDAPAPGSRLVQTDLARTLRAIADGGPRAFYEGRIADLIVAEMRRGGGIESQKRAEGKEGGA